MLSSAKNDGETGWQPFKAGPWKREKKDGPFQVEDAVVGYVTEPELNEPKNLQHMWHQKHTSNASGEAEKSIKMDDAKWNSCFPKAEKVYEIYPPSQ